jgi:hypothetical protein
MSATVETATDVRPFRIDVSEEEIDVPGTTSDDAR